MGISKDDLVRTSNAYKSAKAKHTRIGGQPYSSTSGADLSDAAQRENAARREFDSTYNRYADEMRRAGLNPDSASVWLG